MGAHGTEGLQQLHHLHQRLHDRPHPHLLLLLQNRLQKGQGRVLYLIQQSVFLSWSNLSYLFLDEPGEPGGQT